jgi:hypothetical protein
MVKETEIPKGALCECVSCRAEDGCPNEAVVLVYDGPDDQVGTALCAECASGGE